MTAPSLPALEAELTALEVKHSRAVRKFTHLQDRHGSSPNPPRSLFQTRNECDDLAAQIAALTSRIAALSVPQMMTAEEMEECWHGYHGSPLESFEHLRAEYDARTLAVLDARMAEASASAPTEVDKISWQLGIDACRAIVRETLGGGE